MSEDPAPEVDMEAAMREAMGFSSFTVRRPKNQSETSLPQTTTSHYQDTSAPPSTSNPHLDSANDPSVEEPVQFQPNQAQPAAQPPNYAFTSPISNTYYTRADLEEWARGKANANGDTVFFKPGFVCDDPWARLRDRNGKDMGNAK